MIRFKAFVRKGYNSAALGDIITFGYGTASEGNRTSSEGESEFVFLKCKEEDRERLIHNMDIHSGICAYREMFSPTKGSNTMERTET